MRLARDAGEDQPGFVLPEQLLRAYAIEGRSAAGEKEHQKEGFHGRPRVIQNWRRALAIRSSEEGSFTCPSHAPPKG